MTVRTRILTVLAATALVAVAAAPVASLGAEPTAGSAKAKPKNVKVRDDFFSPTAVKVKSGKKVKWSWGNQNIDSHDVTLKSGPKGVKKSKFRSHTAAIGYTYTKKFKKKGTYNFYCTIHPSVMLMTVEVKK